VYVNQQVNGGQWKSLGSFYFESDSSYRVSITAQPGPSSTCADAVKFVKTADPGILPPIADFTADRTAAGVLTPIQFYDQSAGTVAEYLWDFGDGQTSTQQNPSHDYASEGNYTVSLTATNTSGADTRSRSNYIQIMGAAVENIYLCDGYSDDGLWISWCENELQKLGAVKNNGVWVYTNPDKGMTYYIHIVRDAEGMERALKEKNAHVIFNGHSNYGLGALFATSQETREQRIYGVEYVDDVRFLNISTDMVSIKIDGMQSGQAYPDWTPYLSNGESALMPYDFDEGMPAYNYYLTYSVPGDPTVYKVELPDGSFIERFPDSRKPAWDFSLNPLTPDPVENTEYFITNPGDEYNHTEFIGEWSMGGDCYEDGTDCLGYNYHYSAPGSGADIATWYFVVEAAGDYAVEASWESSSSNARNAKYTIFHSGGSTTVEADQTVSTAGGFVLLGEFYFDAGFYMVQLSDDADGTVIADAVHLEPTDNPDDIIKSEFRSRNPISGDAPLTVEFDSRAYASENITDFHYDFGDGNTSDEEDPVHTYSSPGIYTVIHRITDALGRQDTEIKKDFVAVGMDQSLHAEFTQTSRFIELGTSAYFYDQSSGEITARHWDFGDGQTSDEQNPRHTYETIGTYTVTLTVSGPGGSDTETEMDFIYVVLETSYTDNSYQYKSHFVSGGGATSTFGKVVLDASSVTVPEEEFGYSRLFYGSCNSGPYYIGKLHRGIMYFTTDNQDSYNAHRYLRYYLMGYSDSEIISRLPEYYQYYNFNLKPPSMR
jgi:PKD repeat protein